MKRAYYSNSIKNFLCDSSMKILGELTVQNDFSLEQPQREAWIE